MFALPAITLSHSRRLLRSHHTRSRTRRAVGRHRHTQRGRGGFGCGLQGCAELEIKRLREISSKIYHTTLSCGSALSKVARARLFPTPVRFSSHPTLCVRGWSTL